MEELKLKKVQPRANTVITTGLKIFSDEEYHKLCKSETVQSLKFKNTAEAKNLHRLVQKVIAVGPVVHDFKVGDIVKINPLHYLDRKLVAQRESLEKDVLDLTGTRVKETYSELDYKFPTINIDDEDCLLLYDRDIDYIILDGEGKFVTDLENY